MGFLVAVDGVEAGWVYVVHALPFEPFAVPHVFPLELVHSVAFDYFEIGHSHRLQ